MKKSTIFSAMLLLATAVSHGQGNVQLVPGSGNVCNPMPITFHISGNSFNPISYLWSTGETSPVIEITNSGTYTLSITGYHGNSQNLATITKTANYNVLPAPNITALTDLWVCKLDTVKLAAVSGYNAIYWSNGATGVNFQKVMNSPGTPGSPGLDTMSVSYIASITNVCYATSERVMLRSIRRPPGVGQYYEGKMDIKSSDSIPSGLVNEYLFPISYEMVFSEIDNAANVITYTTAPGSRKAPASMLTPGSAYHVESTPIIAGKHYCHGMTSTIGIKPSSNNRLSSLFTPDAGVNNFKVYDVQGRLLMEKQDFDFNQEWLDELPQQILIIQRTGTTHETIRTQFVK